MITLRQAVQDYLALRRSLGFKLTRVGPQLEDFVGFLAQHHAGYITSDLALAWATQGADGHAESWAAQRLSIVRLFARYRSATDPRTQMPPAGVLPFRPQRARPYLYSEHEIEQLLQAALRLPYRYQRGALRPWVFHCLLGLLSVTGLRLGEARNLELQDVDLTAGVLTIRGAKFGKTRLVPLHLSICTVLADYLARRERHWAGRAVSPYVSARTTSERSSTKAPNAACRPRRAPPTLCCGSRSSSGLKGR